MAFPEDFIKDLPNIPESDDDDEEVEIFDVTQILQADKLNGKDMNFAVDNSEKTIGDMIRHQETELLKDNRDQKAEVLKENMTSDENVEFTSFNWPHQGENDTESDMIVNVADRVDDISDKLDVDGHTAQNEYSSFLTLGKQDRSKVPVIDLSASNKRIQEDMHSEIEAVDSIWEFINSQDEAAKRLAKRKEIAEREYKEHKAWCERQAKAKANYVPDPAIGDFVNNEITLVSFDDSPVEEEEVVSTSKSSKFETSEEAEVYYKEAAQTLLKKRLALEARKLEEERLANLEIARRNRIQARMKEAEEKRTQQVAARERRKYDAMMKVLLESTFPANGELFYSQNISHNEPVSCLPYKKNFWENHLHLSCTVAKLILPTIAYCICLPEFRAIQLSHLRSKPNFHVVLECTRKSKKWEVIRDTIPPNGLGASIGDSLRINDDHDIFDSLHLSLYSRAAIDGEKQMERSLERPNMETCIGIFRNFNEYEAVFEVLKSPSECGVKLVGLRTAYLTEKQKVVARPLFNVSIDSSPLLIMCISGVNCRELWDTFLGPLDPHLARRLEPQSIRARFGQNKDENVIWVSRTFFDLEPKTVRAEVAFFFAGRIDGKNAEAAEAASKRIVTALIPL